MAFNMRELIRYHGLSDCSCEGLVHFKQMNTDFTFCIPMQKTDIEQITRVWVKPYIIQQKLVRTPKGISLEGQIATGYKLMIVGDISYKVEYVALDVCQGLRTAHTTIPFCGYVVLPEKFNSNSVVTASIEVEDIYSEQIDIRCIYNNVTMMLIADIC